MFEIPHPKRDLAWRRVSVIGALDFGFVSDLVLRISDFLQ
jgi:hypothetical protein